MRITLTQEQLDQLIFDYLIATEYAESSEDINRITYRVEAASQEVSVTVDVAE